MEIKILFVFGTRPEAIKLAPLINELASKEEFICKVCVTGQHKTMLNQVLDFFKITPDFDLQLMKHNQTLASITADIVKDVDEILTTQFTPDFIIVQGDTTTAMAAALSAFYKKIGVIHIEAGLRTCNKYSPHPEEINRAIIARIADFHFAPTQQAANNLIREGVEPENVWKVGNTVIDALLTGLEIIKETDSANYDNHFDFIDKTKKLILVTGHRRENFGEPFENICKALKQVAIENPNVQIVYPVHLNPNVREPVERILSDCPRIHLIEPVEYSEMIWLLNECYIVVTDSGGVQEEAPALGKPVLVMREVTERMEGIESGTAKLIGTDYNNIIKECNTLLNTISEYQKMAKANNPYGDGTTSKQIVEILKEVLITEYHPHKL